MHAIAALLRPSRALAALLLLALLAGCGFHLRGPRPMDFRTIYLDLNPYTDFAKELSRQIRTSGTTVPVERRDEAEVVLQVVRDEQEKNIVSLSAGGTVREFQLRQRFRFRVQDRNGREVLPLSEISVTRDITYNDNIALAKEQEESVLYRDMQSDLVQQIVRRLASVRMDRSRPAPTSPTPIL